VALLQSAFAETTLISSVPPSGATGVSPASAVSFTFSGSMNPETVETVFYDASFNFYETTPAWSGGDTVLTCTPLTPFATNATISWVVTGQDANGADLGGLPIGAFTTGTGSGGGGGSGTNAITTFSVGKVHHYNQTSSGAPVLDPATPYGFSGVTALASNRTATSVTLTLPTAAVSNLTHLPPPSAEVFLLAAIDTSLGTFDATFPSGTYTFFVQSAASNQTVMVTLPTTNSMPQPNAPHLTNFLATQTVDAGKDFVLGWDAFSGGTASDYIDVDIGDAYTSPEPDHPGALPGTARTFTIPANTLQPNSNYLSRVGFFRHVGATNTDYATAAYRSTYTEFTLITTGGLLVLTNPAYALGTFSFDVLCSSGQDVVVEYTTNLAVIPWQTFLTTNSPGSSFQVVSMLTATNQVSFFRARNGP